MRVNISVDLNLGRTLRRGDTAPLRKEAKAAVKRVTHRYVSRVQASFLEPKSGHFHRRNKRRSSAPGEAPAKQSGHLSRSLKQRIRRSGMERWVEARASYAMDLEKKMGRPFLHPQVAQAERELQEEINAQIDKVLRAK